MRTKVTGPVMLRPAEVAAMFPYIHRDTLRYWANTGKLTSVRTLGGHRRYYADEVMALRSGSETRRQAPGGVVPDLLRELREGPGTP